MVGGKKTFTGAYGDKVDLNIHTGEVRFNGDVVYRGTAKGADEAYDDKVFQVQMTDHMANAGPYGQIC